MGASAALCRRSNARAVERARCAGRKIARTGSAGSVIVEETGAHGVDAQSVNRHLAANLKTDMGLYPRSEARSFFGGNVKMDYRVARPAIDRPFGNERAIVELPKVSSALQRAIRAISTN
jgi:hypothetical protein